MTLVVGTLYLLLLVFAVVTTGIVAAYLIDWLIG